MNQEDKELAGALRRTPRLTLRDKEQVCPRLGIPASCSAGLDRVARTSSTQDDLAFREVRSIGALARRRSASGLIATWINK